MADVNKTILGECIKKALQKNGYSLRKGASVIGMSPANLSRIVNHKATANPKPDTLRKIADGLNIDYSEIENIVNFSIRKRQSEPNRVELADIIDKNEYTTYHGKPVDPVDLEIIKRILKNK